LDEPAAVGAVGVVAIAAAVGDGAGGGGENGRALAVGLANGRVVEAPSRIGNAIIGGEVH